MFDSLEKKGGKNKNCIYIKKRKKGIADSASSLPCVPNPVFPFWRPPLRASLGTQIARGLSRAPISLLKHDLDCYPSLATDMWAEVLGGGGKEGGLHLGPGSLDPPRSSYSYSGRDYNGTFRIKNGFSTAWDRASCHPAELHIHTRVETTMELFASNGFSTAWDRASCHPLLRAYVGRRADLCGAGAQNCKQT